MSFVSRFAIPPDPKIEQTADQKRALHRLARKFAAVSRCMTGSPARREFKLLFTYEVSAF